MLFSELWHEGELCILFASSGLGKSILAVQIGNSISTGEPIPGFKNESISQTVLYFDFELSDKQFEGRYSAEFKNHFEFDDNFIRIELNPDADKPEKITEEEFLINSIEKAIEDTNAKILIIDNITYLRNDTERAKDALPLMKKLKALKRKYDLSILTLTHTPKRDASKPITKNDLSGSIMLFNFCDSSFSIGAGTSDPNVRYIKQIKERFTQQMYDDENVIVCEITKPVNFLQFSHAGYGKEIDYLRNISESEKEVVKEMVQQRYREGKSYREIAKEFNISHMKVQRIIKGKDENPSF
jgi:KaiC/GvpD/RAD55 family RecA-like ATPase